MGASFIRPILVDGDLAYVRLTRGYTAVIDAADVGFVEGFNWHSAVFKGTAYAVRNAPKPCGGQSTLRMHRIITSAQESLVVDHINGDGLDNRRQNLRVVSHALNMRNQSLRSDNKSGLKGIRWREPTQKWNAYINVDGKHYSLGHYATKEEAYAAYIEGSKRFHGEFARAAQGMPISEVRA